MYFLILCYFFNSARGQHTTSPNNGNEMGWFNFNKTENQMFNNPNFVSEEIQPNLEYPQQDPGPEIRAPISLRTSNSKTPYLRQKKKLRSDTTSAPYDYDIYKQPFRLNNELGLLYRRSSGEGCLICYSGKDCIAMNYFRCEYSLSMTGLVDDDSFEDDRDEVVAAPDIREEVDAMMFALVERANENQENYKDCIPHISRYTDCTKENICLGCKTCECDNDGRWNCVVKQKCRSSTRPNCDHRTIIMVIENMRNGNEATWNRVKRSDQSKELISSNIIYNNNSNNTVNVEMADLMYGTPTDGTPPDGQYNETEAETETVTTVVTEAAPIENTTDAIAFNGSIIDDNVIIQPPTNDLVEKVDPVENATDVKISFAEISEWLNVFHPKTTTDASANFSRRMVFVYDDSSTESTTQIVNELEIVKAADETTTRFNEIEQLQDTTTGILDTDNIVFEEMLGILNSGVNMKSHLPIKVKLNESYFGTFSDNDDDNVYNIYEFNDHNAVYDPEIATTITINNPQPITMRSILNTYNTPITDGVINLLASPASKDLTYRTGGKAIIFTDFLDDDKEYKPRLTENNNLDMFDAVNIMKRDVSSVVNIDNSTINDSTISVTTEATFKKENNSDNIDDLTNLRNNVLIPLNTLLRDKHREVEELMKMKNNLILFLNNFKNMVPDLEISNNENINHNNTSEKVQNHTDREKKILSTISQYLPQLRSKLNTGNSTSLITKYMLKLKRDIYEVIRDIVGIRKLTDQTKLPEDLKFLMRALKHYIHKQGAHTTKSKVPTPKTINSRRMLEPRGLIFTSNPVKEGLIKILEAVDRNMPASNALKPLSPETKKIMKRVIKRFYVDEFSRSGLRVYDPQYNLTNDLRNIGTKWNEMTAAIETCAPSDKLYALKLLHHELALDINKMKDALALINFAHSRRMIPVEENVGESIMNKINADLNEMHLKISNLMKEEPVTPAEEESSQVWFTPPHKPKVSFMTQIKNLLRTSKNDILSLLRKKIPKSEIFKELARKQLDAVTRRKLSDYEQTMQKWQDNLGIIKVRNKRTLVDFDLIRNRIKNIIPKYLRGKVRAITAHDARKIKTKNEINKKKKGTTDKPHIHTIITTTPKMIKSTPSTPLSSSSHVTPVPTMMML